MAVQAEPEVVHVPLSQLASALQGTCVQNTFDYWTYEVCFGKTIKQMHGGDVYVIAGQADDITGENEQSKKQKYSHGQVCSNLPGSPARTTNVVFKCAKQATRPRIIEAREPSPCNYEVTVVTALACKDKSYQVLSDDVVTNQHSAAAVDDGSEDWFLEIVDLAEGASMCTVYSTEYKANTQSTSTLKFAE